MRPDILDLQTFYDSRHGQVTRRLVNVQIRSLWPDVTGLRVAGIGFATPFLDAFADEAESVAAIMPPAQGALRWPRTGPSRTSLGREEDLPLADGSVDRMLLVHSLENSPRLHKLMREVWRVLADGGRLLAVVPNRRGLWSLSDRTPFGQGQPYSASQLERTLRAHLFQPQHSRRALYLPPFRQSLLQRLAVPVERLGLRFAPHFAGVLLVEAEKQIYVGTPEPARAKQRTKRRYAAMRGVPVAARDAETLERTDESGPRRRDAGVNPAG